MKAILIMAILSVLAGPAIAEDNIGDWTMQELVQGYIAYEDKAPLDDQLDAFFLGWVDAFRSVYAYEGVVGDEEYQTLFDCTDIRTSTEMRQSILAVAATPEWAEVTVSAFLWAYYRESCVEVLGPISSEEDGT